MSLNIRRAVRMIALPSALLLVVGCGGTEPSDQEGDEQPVSAMSALWPPACTGTGDVGAVTAAINTYCGGVLGCINTTTTHDDIRLKDNSKYCSCYEWLWSRRTLAPYKNVQIIYHNAAQCTVNYHIHVQKKNGSSSCTTTCNNGMQGLWHMDLDTSAPENGYCEDNGGQIDRAYNCSCVATENKQSGACTNP